MGGRLTTEEDLPNAAGSYLTHLFPEQITRNKILNEFKYAAVDRKLDDFVAHRLSVPDNLVHSNIL